MTGESQYAIEVSAVTQYLAQQSDEAAERYVFAYQHRTLVDMLIEREHQLNEQMDKLKIAVAQKEEAQRRAEDQKQAVMTMTAKLDTERAKTKDELEKLAKEQQKLFAVRVRLRDANALNQAMEEQIRKFERDAAAAEAEDR